MIKPKNILLISLVLLLGSGGVMAKQGQSDSDDLLDQKLSDEDYNQVNNFDGEYTNLFEKPSSDPATSTSMIDKFNAQSAIPYAQMGLLHICSDSDLMLQIEGKVSSLALDTIHRFSLEENSRDDVLEIQNTLTGVEMIFHHMACYSACAESDETCLSDCQFVVSLTSSSMQAKAPYAIIESQAKVCQSNDRRQGAFFIGQLPDEVKFKAASLLGASTSGSAAQLPDEELSLSELSDCMIAGQQKRGIAQIRQGLGTPPNVGSYGPNSASIDLKCLNELVSQKNNPSIAKTPVGTGNSADGAAGCALRGQGRE